MTSDTKWVSKTWKNILIVVNGFAWVTPGSFFLKRYPIILQLRVSLFCGGHYSSLHRHLLSSKQFPCPSFWLRFVYGRVENEPYLKKMSTHQVCLKCHLGPVPTLFLFHKIHRRHMLFWFKVSGRSSLMNLYPQRRSDYGHGYVF